MFENVQLCALSSTTFPSSLVTQDKRTSLYLEQYHSSFWARLRDSHLLNLSFLHQSSEVSTATASARHQTTMSFRNQHEFGLSAAEEAAPLYDPYLYTVAPEDAVFLFCDHYKPYDIKHIGFNQSKEMLYRGKFRFSRKVFSQLPRQVQAIYHKFANYRTNDQSSSGSSNDLTSLAPQNDPSEVHDPMLVDNTDTTGLLEVPISIDGKIPLAQAYKQYEPRGFRSIRDSRLSQSEPVGWAIESPEAAALSRKRKQVGFSKEEVVMYGGLTCTPCRQSNLSDPLFTTLFKQENFYNTTQEVYNVITPALKLAEKFITDPSLIGYWSTLAFGTRTIDEKLTSETGRCHERLVKSVDVTGETYAQTIKLLNRIGKVVEFRFELDDDFANERCYAKAVLNERSWNLAPEYHEILSQGYLWPTGTPFPMARQWAKDPLDELHLVHLSPDYAIAARRFSATKNQDVAARLRFSFSLAVNIVHELAHVLERISSQTQFERMVSTCTTLEELKHVLDPRRHAGLREAYWGDSSWAEAGSRWEWQTFGGRVNPIAMRCDASLGMVLYNGDGWCKVPESEPADTAIGMCIKMGFIEEIQQQSFWTRQQRSLKFPLSGAMAYFRYGMVLGDFDHYLTQRNQECAGVSDPVTDPADIRMGELLTAAIAQDDPEDAEQRPSKRRRLDRAGEVKPHATRAREIKKASKRGGLRQTLIRKFPSKAEADAKATREEAIASVAQKSQRDRAAEEDFPQQSQREREAEEEFSSVPPDQTRLDDFLVYDGEDPQDAGLPDGYAELPYVDPATLRPEDLTIEDKWKLAEEWVCLSMNWEPVEFLSQRCNHPDWRPEFPFNPDDPTCFTQHTLAHLIHTRTLHPGKSWPERRAAEKKLYDQKRKVADTIAQIDELITYLGFSQIESHRMAIETGTFPMGISIANFPSHKPLLDAFRLTQKIQNTSDYASAVQQGQVSASASSTGLIKEASTLNPEPPTTQTAKITDYYSTKAKEAEPTDSRSMASHSADPAPFPPLAKVPTPEEVVRKYEAWVAAGADMGRRPGGMYPTQLLSAGLGGSLQDATPEGLARVVAERERKIEADKVERKRKEAKARADAAEERKRLERGDRHGSESGSAGSKESEL